MRHEAQEIRLYIYTDAAALNADRAKVSYMLQFMKNGTDAGSRKDHMTVEGNQKAATLEAMMDAIARISDGNEIPVLIICHCPGVIQAINQHQYLGWLRNGWKNSRGLEIEHADKWERVIKLFRQKTKQYETGAFCVYASAPSDQDAGIMDELGAGSFEAHTNLA